MCMCACVPFYLHSLSATYTCVLFQQEVCENQPDRYRTQTPLSVPIENRGTGKHKSENSIVYTVKARTGDTKSQRKDDGPQNQLE